MADESVLTPAAYNLFFFFRLVFFFFFLVSFPPELCENRGGRPGLSIYKKVMLIIKGSWLF